MPGWTHDWEARETIDLEWYPRRHLNPDAVHHVLRFLWSAAGDTCRSLRLRLHTPVALHGVFHDRVEYLQTVMPGIVAFYTGRRAARRQHEGTRGGGGGGGPTMTVEIDDVRGTDGNWLLMIGDHIIEGGPHSVVSHSDTHTQKKMTNVGECLLLMRVSSSWLLKAIILCFAAGVKRKKTF